MKTIRLLSSLMLLAAATAQATLYITPTYSVGTAIPDGNPGGLANSQIITLPSYGDGTIDDIRDVTVTLNISGGYNGDLYGYLVGPGGGFTVLLDRVGTGSGSEPQFSYGFSTSGFSNVTLDDSAATSIHDVLNPTGGTYQSDGGTLSTAYDGQASTGTWTLFLADLSGGDTSTLVSWSMQIDVVPEPTTWALIGFAILFLMVATVRALWARRVANCVNPLGVESVRISD